MLRLRAMPASLSASMQERLQNINVVSSELLPTPEAMLTVLWASW